MNLIILSGRFTSDPEMRYGKESGKAVARFNLAVDRDFKRDGDPDADFFRCACFGKSAEFVEKYFKKGMKANIYGRMRNNDYKDRNGNLVRSYNVDVDHIEFGESKKAFQSSSAPADDSVPTNGAAQGSSLPEDNGDGLFDWGSESGNGAGDTADDDNFLPFN